MKDILKMILAVTAGYEMIKLIGMALITIVIIALIIVTAEMFPMLLPFFICILIMVFLMKGKKIMAKKCKSCVYRGKTSYLDCCDYIMIMNHSRGCDPENCDKYEKGNPKRRRQGPFGQDFVG